MNLSGKAWLGRASLRYCISDLGKDPGRAERTVLSNTGDSAVSTDDVLLATEVLSIASALCPTPLEGNVVASSESSIVSEFIVVALVETVALRPDIVEGSVVSFESKVIPEFITDVLVLSLSTLCSETIESGVCVPSASRFLS